MSDRDSNLVGLEVAHGVERQDLEGYPRSESSTIQNGVRTGDSCLGCTICTWTQI